jgi:hypothetical protein
MSSYASARRSSRRQVLQSGALGLLGAQLPWGCGSRMARAGIALDAAPDVPLDVGHDPQFLFDLHVVDCTWGLHEKKEPVKRVSHAAKKHGDGPLLTGDQPSHLAVARDPADGLFRMWYQLNHRLEFPEGRKKGQAAYRTYVGYAQSADGIDWQRPDLGLFPHAADQTVPKNCVLYRPDSPESYFHAPQILEAPERDRRGYRYLMVYLGGGPNPAYRGIRLVGSHDGVHWDLEHEQLIAPIGSDHHNTIVYDPARDEYALYLRAKHIYLAPGQRGGYDTIEEGEAGVRINTGQSRRGVARLASKSLWTEWSGAPQTILTPDETDADNGYNYFYGMPTRYYAGVYFGFLQSFRMNDYMHGELAFSRDGIRFDRLPWRPKIVEYGPEGAWDSVMILASPYWIDKGDEWWIYYNGWDGPHGTPERTGGIGLAKLRKEGFISLRGPATGGVVCTREIRWPGGDLSVNADASAGELRVRVSDALRKPRAGYDYDDGPVFTGDAVANIVKWNGRSLDALKGEVVRLEFFLKNADLYTFRAATT